MGMFTDVFTGQAEATEQEIQRAPDGLKGFKGFKAPPVPAADPLLALKTLLAPQGASEIQQPRGAPSDDPLTPCEACGCTNWHRMLDAGAWWCSRCWPWPPDLLPVSLMTVAKTESGGTP